MTRKITLEDMLWINASHNTIVFGAVEDNILQQASSSFYWLHRKVPSLWKANISVKATFNPIRYHRRIKIGRDKIGKETQTTKAMD